MKASVGSKFPFSTSGAGFVRDMFIRTLYDYLNTTAIQAFRAAMYENEWGPFVPPMSPRSGADGEMTLVRLITSRHTRVVT